MILSGISYLKGKKREPDKEILSSGEREKVEDQVHGEPRAKREGDRRPQEGEGLWGGYIAQGAFLALALLFRVGAMHNLWGPPLPHI